LGPTFMVEETSTYAGMAAVPVIMALVSVLVKPFISDERIYPVAALVLGLGWNIGVALVMNLPLVPSVALGVVVGLAASGLYSGGKTVVK
jgi:hypothetical protein